jgi:PAS domain S-box-containing protein
MEIEDRGRAGPGAPATRARAAGRGRRDLVVAASRGAVAPPRWDDVLDSLPAHLVVLDGHGTIVAANAAWCAFADENGGDHCVGTDYLDVCDRAGDATSARFAAGIRALLAGGTEPVEVVYPCHGPSDRRWFAARAMRHRGSGPASVIVEHRDVTSGQVLADRQRAEAGILDQLAAAVVATDLDCRITSWNRAAEQLHGWSAGEALGRSIEEVTIPRDNRMAAGRILWTMATGKEWTGELELQRKDGSAFPAHVRMAPLRSPDGTVAGYIAVSLDLTEQRRGEQELAAVRDRLRAVTDHMGEGLCTLDELGRLTYLNPAAQMLLASGAADLVGSRLADFLVGAEGSAARALADLSGEGDHEVIRSDDELLRSGDGTTTPVAITATPLRDGAGTSWVVVVTDVSGRRAREEALEEEVEAVSWLARLQAALAEGRMVLHAQPIVELSTGVVIQHELLLRMMEPDGTLVMPGDFIPAAEQIGFMPVLDRWVIDRGLELAASGMSVELNLCGGSFADPGLLPHVRAALQRTGADPSTIIFEVTETDLVSNLTEAHGMLAELRALGFKIALDDFGTGYAGFTYLKSLPVDHLKIDREFVHDLATNEASRHVVRAVVHLAGGLGLQTVAEGVEDEVTLDALRMLRVDHAQGYLFGRPAPITDGAAIAGGVRSGHGDDGA